MKRVNTHEAKTHLSRILEDVENGETVLVCRRNVPITELRPLAPERKHERPIGLAAGRFHVPDSFFDSLPLELITSSDGAD